MVVLPWTVSDREIARPRRNIFPGIVFFPISVLLRHGVPRSSNAVIMLSSSSAYDAEFRHKFEVVRWQSLQPPSNFFHKVPHVFFIFFSWYTPPRWRDVPGGWGSCYYSIQYFTSLRRVFSLLGAFRAAAWWNIGRARVLDSQDVLSPRD